MRNDETQQLKRTAKLVAGLLAFALAFTCFAPSGTPAAPEEAQAYEQVEQIVNDGHGTCDPGYLVIHETANPGASAYNHVLLYSRGYDYAVQYVMELDGSKVYHTMHDNRKAWAVGNGNRYCVNIELAHATNQADFNSQWSEAVKWAGDYLNKRGWSVDRMISHNQARLNWGGSDHTDPLSYFSSYGKSWNMFVSEVREYMATGQTSGTYVDGGTSTPSYDDGEESMGVYTVTASALNVRNGIWGSYVKTYANGTRFDLYEVKDGWGRTPSGWICLQYTTYGGSTASSGKSAGTYTFTTTVNIRSGAGTGYSVVGQYSAGGSVTVYDVVEAGGYYWGKYTAYSGYTRYVALGVVGGKAYAA